MGKILLTKIAVYPRSFIYVLQVRKLPARGFGRWALGSYRRYGETQMAMLVLEGKELVD